MISSHKTNPYEHLSANARPQLAVQNGKISFDTKLCFQGQGTPWSYKTSNFVHIGILQLHAHPRGSAWPVEAEVHWFGNLVIFIMISYLTNFVDIACQLLFSKNGF